MRKHQHRDLFFSPSRGPMEEYNLDYEDPIHLAAALRADAQVIPFKDGDLDQAPTKRNIWESRHVASSSHILATSASGWQSQQSSDLPPQNSSPTASQPSVTRAFPSKARSRPRKSFSPAIPPIYRRPPHPPPRERARDKSPNAKDHRKHKKKRKKTQTPEQERETQDKKKESINSESLVAPTKYGYQV